MNEKEFYKFIEKIVEVRNIMFMDYEDIKWKIPLPKTNEEFKKFTKKYYGVELNADIVIWDDGIEYRIKEKQEDYSKGELYSLWDKKFSQYDGLKVLLTALFGELSCGGVAVSHYGQTKLSKEKRDLLINWDNLDNDEKRRNKIMEQRQDLAEIFGGKK